MSYLISQLYCNVQSVFCVSHPYETLEPFVSGQQFLVQFDSLQVAATELSVGLPHVICTLT